MMRRRLNRAAGFAAVVVLVGAFGVSGAYAQDGDKGADGTDVQPSGTSRIEMLLDLAASGSPEAIAEITAYLYSEGATKVEVKDRAIQLIRELSGDMIAVQGAAETIATAAENALAGAQIERFDIDDNYRPNADTYAFDFGTADAPVPVGFERVTEGDERVEGTDGLHPLRRPSEKPVISSGILGIKKFKTAVKPGFYRLVIMTDDLGEWKQLDSPLGKLLRINGVELVITTDNPSTWRGQNFLGNYDLAAYDPSRPMSGGMIVIEIEITENFFELELLGDELTFLAGLTLEPIEEEEFRKFDPGLVEVAEEIGQVLAEVVTAAGEETPVEDTEVSPN